MKKGYELTQSSTLSFGDFRRDEIGTFNIIRGAYGPVMSTYWDTTASHRLSNAIEHAITYTVGSTYANTHTQDSAFGRQTTDHYQAAITTILKSVDADPTEYALLKYGSGFTGIAHKIHALLGIHIPPETLHALDQHHDKSIKEDFLHDYNNCPVVYITSYEHHSNELPFRHGLCKVVVVDHVAEGEKQYTLDINDLREKIEQHKRYQKHCGFFSAVSNMTGAKTDIPAVKEAFDALKATHPSTILLWDCSAAIAHIPVNVGNMGDGILFATHKKFGAPGTEGLANELIKPGAVRLATDFLKTPQDLKRLKSALLATANAADWIVGEYTANVRTGAWTHKNGGNHSKKSVSIPEAIAHKAIADDEHGDLAIRKQKRDTYLDKIYDEDEKEPGDEAEMEAVRKYYKQVYKSSVHEKLREKTPQALRALETNWYNLYIDTTQYQEAFRNFIAKIPKGPDRVKAKSAFNVYLDPRINRRRHAAAFPDSDSEIRKLYDQYLGESVNFSRRNGTLENLHEREVALLHTAIRAREEIEALMQHEKPELVPLHTCLRNCAELPLCYVSPTQLQDDRDNTSNKVVTTSGVCCSGLFGSSSNNTKPSKGPPSNINHCQ